MTTTLRATFDGKAFIPDEPVDFQIGQQVEIQITAAKSVPQRISLQQLIEKWASEPVDSSVPTDLAAQVDHYLYGTPKRDQR